ncbi:protein kinase [Novymonas esmeraldas]|uniref:Protein kinase n=1 Tax=Novymonas esmeraldas TaxID=1808958 RepID=A0AAW0EQN7_9TRYP
MSSSDLFTTAYVSSELSAKALSSTISEPRHASSGTTPQPAPARALAMPATAAAAAAAAAENGVAQQGELERLTAPVVEGEGEGLFDVLLSSDAAGSHSLPPSIVDRRDISLADISQMRMEGCRARHTSLNVTGMTTASPRGTFASSMRSISASPMTLLAGRARDQVVGGGDTPALATPGAAATAWTSLVGLGRSLRRRSSTSSLRASALDTSIAILQHMAHDTAARIEAMHGAPSPAGTLSTVASGSGSPTPPPLQLLSPPSTGTSSAAAAGTPAAGARIGAFSHNSHDMEYPISVAGHDAEPHSGPLHATHTDQFLGVEDSPSPLNSLSESELRGGHLRPGAFYRPASHASAAQLAGFGKAAPALRVGQSARQASPPRRADGPASASAAAAAQLQGDGAAGCRTRHAEPSAAPHQRLFAVVAVAAGEGEEAGGVSPTSSHQTRDVSVYNHDFQQIVPREVKEALQRNMRPLYEDDDDEEDALLHDGLSVRTPSPFLPYAKMSHTACDGCISSEAPVTDGAAAALAAAADAPPSAPIWARRSTGLLVVSPTAPALLPAEAALPAAPSWHTGAPAHAASLGAADAAAAAGLSASGSAVPFQTWRFPSLGKLNSVSSQRRMSLEEDAGVEEARPPPPVSPTTTGATQVRQSAMATVSGPDSQPTQGTFSSGLRQQQSSEWALLRHNGRQTTDKRHTLDTVCSASSTAATVVSPPVGDTRLCASSMSSAAARTLPTASVGAGGSILSTGAGARLSASYAAAAAAAAAAPAATATAACSQPRVRTGVDAADAGDVRKLEMVYSVYERLLRASSSPSHGSATVAAKSLAQLRVRSFTDATAAAAAAAAAAAPAPTPSSMRAPPLAAIGTPSTVTSRGGGGSPSMSYSGALGRSTRYYSFGKRISLSHPNRQRLPHQYLGSAFSLHAVSARPRTPDLVAVAGASAAHECGSTTTTSSATCVRRRSLDASLLRRIEARPLLQCTLFLRQNLCRIDAAEQRRDGAARGGVTEAVVSPDHRRTSAEVAAAAAAASPAGTRLRTYTFPTEVQSPTAAPSTLSATDADGVGSTAAESHALAPNAATIMALPTPAAYAARSSNSTSSSSGTHVPSASSALQSSSSSMGRRTNVSSLSIKCIQDAQERQEEQLLRNHGDVHTDPVVTATTAVAYAPPVALQTSATATATATTTAAVAEQRDVVVGSPAPQYHRALTEADRLVRHVHGVDGVEREVDNESMDLVVYVGMRLMGWLEVVSLLGCGSFGQVFLCKDLRICDGHFVHPSEIDGEDYEYWNCSHVYLPFSSVDAVPTHRPLVAVKVVKSVPLLEQQSVLEAEMLVLIGAQTARAPPPAEGAGEPRPPTYARTTEHGGASTPPPEDPRCVNIAKVLADGVCYGHHCIVMERYGANLYEYIAANDHLGLPMYQIRSIGAQLFSALSLVHEECHIVHADVKLENVLLTLDSCRGTLRARASPPGPTTAATTPASASAAATPASAATPAAGAAVRGNNPRATSPSVEPPRHQQRTEGTPATPSSSASPSPPAERSCMMLRLGPSAVARHRLGLSNRRRSSTTLTDVSVSALALPTYNRQNTHALRSSSASHTALVSGGCLPAPEPRRLQTLNQSAGMLSAAPSGASMASLGSTAVGGRGRYKMHAPPPDEAPAAPAAATIPMLHVRLIDFSSSCYDAGPFYQYIQSRYYRAPEVIVGASYNSGIDVWSTGCVLAELLLGMPLLAGCNDHHQLQLIEEMIGPLPASVVEEGDNADLYYTATTAQAPNAGDAAAPPPPPSRPFALRSREGYLELTGGEPQPYRRYFTYQTLQELVRHCPLTLEERRMSNGLPPYVPANESSAIPADATPSPTVRSDMMKQRFLLFDLLRRLLQTDPKQRLTAAQALEHPFFTSAPPYLKTFAIE